MEKKMNTINHRPTWFSCAASKVRIGKRHMLSPAIELHKGMAAAALSLIE